MQALWWEYIEDYGDYRHEELGGEHSQREEGNNANECDCLSWDEESIKCNQCFQHQVGIAEESNTLNNIWLKHTEYWENVVQSISNLVDLL